MKRRRNKGFMFILVLIAIAMVGAAIFLLASSSRSLLFDANRALLEARTRNLTASALGWAVSNRERLRRTPDGARIELDATGLGVPDATLTVSLEGEGTKTRRIRIRTASPRGRRVANRSSDYPMSPDR